VRATWRAAAVRALRSSVCAWLGFRVRVRVRVRVRIKVRVTVRVRSAPA